MFLPTTNATMLPVASSHTALHAPSKLVDFNKGSHKYVWHNGLIQAQNHEHWIDSSLLKMQTKSRCQLTLTMYTILIVD